MKLLSAFAIVSLATAALCAREESVTSSSFPGSTTVTSVGATSTVAEFAATATTLTVDGTTTTWTASNEDTSTEVTVSGTTTTLTVDGTTTDLTLTQDATIELTLDGLTTTWVVGDASTDIAIDGTATTLTVTGATTTQWIVSPTETEVQYAGTTITFTSADGTTESTMTFDGTTATLGLDEQATTLSLDGTEVALAYEGTEATLTITSSEEESSSSKEEDSSTTDESSTSEESSTEESTTAEESSTTSEESSTTTEESTTESTSEESTTEESTTESTTSGESSTSEESTASTSGTASPPTAPAPTTNPTYCEVVRGPLTPEEEVQLQVLFSDRAGASAFADYVVSYASQLVAQISDVANIAVGYNNYAFTTAFDTIDIPGILGLASAAPIYTCFLSSLWAEALSNPQRYAKRAVPTQDEKIKLIVLFEKRENSGMNFDYAELLVDETNDLIAEIQNVSAAAANGDLGAYASLFANVDVPYFLSTATEAPIYTEGLSAALQTALASYSESVFRPTVTTMTTRTYTTVNTIVTNFVNGTVTVPTTIVSAETVVTVEPVGQVQATSTALQAAPAPTANAPVNKVTTEVVTLGNGRVETRTVTICVENCDTVVAESTRRPAAVHTVTTRPNVAVYTQVQNGVTYTHTIEIQTKNAALKKVAALGAGILGGAALLL